MSQELRAPLEAGLRALGLELSPAQVDTLMEFQALLGKWNKVYNLTAVRDPQEMLTHHLLDSLAAVPALQRHLAQMPAREGRTAMLEVGSGGGLPGVRATPTGISAVIDADGRVLASLPMHRAGRIDTTLPPPHAPTLFARYGNILPVGFALLLLALAIAFRRRGR